MRLRRVHAAVDPPGPAPENVKNTGPEQQPSMSAPDNGPTPVRLAHFSDIHVSARPPGWRARDWLGKRLSGWINLSLLGRGRRFARADEVVAALMAELRQLPPDRVVFSGDATALGFEAELARAAELLGLAGGDPLPGLAVPGNHDYYVPRDARAGHFERHFAPWLTGERVDGAVYPFAQRVGPLWLVAVNTSVPTFLPWDASGHTGPEQLSRLGHLLERLTPGPRVLVTHYPICLDSGRSEGRSHGLRDLTRLVDVAARGGVCLWLHGHRHGPYYHANPGQAPFPVICAGSATQRGHWSYKRYTVEGSRFTAHRREFDPQNGTFRDAGEFTLELPV
jgi:3',5'-cyclic AMP phosphodiesterase CpdA